MQASGARAHKAAARRTAKSDGTPLELQQRASRSTRWCRGLLSNEGVTRRQAAPARTLWPPAHSRAADAAPLSGGAGANAARAAHAQCCPSPETVHGAALSGRQRRRAPKGAPPLREPSSQRDTTGQVPPRAAAGFAAGGTATAIAPKDATWEAERWKVRSCRATAVQVRPFTVRGPTRAPA